MASQNPSDTTAQGAAVPETLPDRTQNPADNQQGESKNAAKKAAKAAKMAADKAEKAANKGIGKAEAKKASKKKVEGAALIGIDVSKQEDFPGWYQQVLTKGDMLDYYDVSGCFILKVRAKFLCCSAPVLTCHSPLHILSGRRSSNGSTNESRRWVSRTALSPCSCRKMCCSARKITLRVLPLRSPGSPTRMLTLSCLISASR